MSTLSRLHLKSSESFKSINNAITNNSKSKQTYGFSKAQRFSQPKPTCIKNYYAGQQMKTRRSGAGIGYSSKFDFTKDLTCSPSSNRYRLKSEFEQKVEKKKGFFMGLGREKLSTGGYINRQLCRTPSATKYKIQLNNKNKAPVFTMRQKTKMINKTMTIQAQNENPGPADYLNPQNFTQSKYQSQTNRFSTISYKVSRSQRFQKNQSRSPGPGAYNQNKLASLSNVGKYIVATGTSVRTFRGGTNAKFDNSKRVTQFDQITSKKKFVPGVGSYRMPSQFGQYDGPFI